MSGLKENCTLPDPSKVDMFCLYVLFEKEHWHLRCTCLIKQNKTNISMNMPVTVKSHHIKHNFGFYFACMCV